jgi:hypothetical protein
VTYIDALAWTYILETPVVLGLGRLWGCGLGRGLLAALVTSGSTHPAVWVLALAMPIADYAAWGWYALEGGVCCVEALILGRIMRLSPRNAWLLSILANSVSAFTGRYLL